ncbi:WD40-repeat-containing domain protein [Xylaria sp. FL1777]|nr:WD40-repeat-containing domain protein [Xylaria sp. FL1777]
MSQDYGDSGAHRPNANSAKSSSSSLSRKFLTLLPNRQKSNSRLAKPRNEFGLNILYEPDDATTIIADFIFIHGLRGGSSTTWCLNQDPEYFWPKEWLPQDPDFNGVRIHSFGYNANWATWLKSPLDVHAFGQSLVEELLSDPKVKAQDTPIVLIGHSMGGLVIKKACILSKTNPNFAQVANRLHSFYFLGTPHRGANLAVTLNNLLRISGSGRRPFVSGLEPKSEVIRTLGDEFRLHYSGIHLHTFYETQPTPPVGMIVDIGSATLGYAEERPQLMNANHRGLVKFESIHDSNFRSLRNRLASTVQQIRGESQTNQPLPLILDPMFLEMRPQPYQINSQQLETIGEYLGIDESYNDRLSSLDDTRLEGSCSWLTAKPSFQKWQYSNTTRYFHLKGAPAVGKSTIASYVIDHLHDSPTCYYFFKGGEKIASSLCSFLCSIAYQMAKVNPDIRDALFQLSQLGQPADTRNLRSIWHIVFTGCVFHTNFHRQHFWVIDALDEVTESAPLDVLFSLLSKIDSSMPLKVFITSRPSHVLDNLFVQLPTITELITPDDSVGDIRLFVESWSENLPVNGTPERTELIDKIVSMSRGSFLWTVLVMKQLQEAITVEEVHDALREVPQKMNEIYQRNINKMETSRSKVLAKHIITWAICAICPLTVDQMRDAIKLSLGITLARDLRANLQYLCGQFLDVDNQSHIQVIHETARAFLINPKLDSEFRIDFPQGHQMLAMACLNHILSDELKYSRRRRSVPITGSNKTSMGDYACLYFSEHVFRATSSSDELFDLLVKFFNTNVLSWIERIAHLKDLDCLNRTSRHLSSYLGRRVKDVPLLSGDLDAWTIDLPKIVTQFSVNLLSDPTAIHTLVPPFCPRNSAVYRHFGHAKDGIKLLGAWNRGWGDRICSISYHGIYPAVVAARDQRFAIGLSDGLVTVYHTSTCEEVFAVSHGESVSALEFGFTSKFLASSGLRHVRLWDAATGNQLFNFDTDSRTLALAFDENDTWLMTASSDRNISKRRITDGSLLSSMSWMDNLASEYADFAPCPHAAKISFEQQAMAIVYRNKPVQLWSFVNERLIGACIRPGTNNKRMNPHPIVFCAVFNPNPAYPRLLVSYWDDFIATFDIMTCKPQVWTSASLDQVAVAQNGRTFAGGDSTGSITIFDFETLQSLYKIEVQDYPVTALAFTDNNLRIVDTRGTHANVWEPLILISQDTDSRFSEPRGSVHQDVNDRAISVVDRSAAITFLHCCEETGVAFCGRKNGRVDTCDLGDPEKTICTLYKHGGGSFNSVTCINWSHKPRILASSDSAASFRVMQITTGPRREWIAEILFEARLQQGYPVRQVLVHQDGSLVLVSSSLSDSVWSVTSKKEIATIAAHKRSVWKWFIRPSSPSQLVLFQDNTLKLFNWVDLTELATDFPSPFGLAEVDQGVKYAEADAISISSEGDDLVLVQKPCRGQPSLHVMPSHSATTTKIHVFDVSALESYPTKAGDPSEVTSPLNSSPQTDSRMNCISLPQLKGPFPSPVLLSARRRPYARCVADIPGVESIIGTVKKFDMWYLIFLSKRGWVCSVEISRGGRMSLETFQKHFFVPSVWTTGNSPLIAKVRRNQDIIFVYQDRIFAVKNGLDNGEHVPLL